MSIKEIPEYLIYGFGIFSGIKLINFLFGSKKKRKKYNRQISGINTDDEYKYYCYHNADDLNFLGEKYAEAIECSISQTPIRFPVITQYGHTYEKYHLFIWLKKNDKDPITKQELKITDLRVNINLLNFVKFLILQQKYNKEHSDEPIKKAEILD